MVNASELVLNEDNSVYHLHLHAGEVAETVITVGDPDRLEKITRHFDSIELRRKNREFLTATGKYRNKRISVISTGIGPDNIDIVFNELDILKRFELPSGKKLNYTTPYTFIRLGTTGTSRKDIKVDDFIVSEYAVGLDNLLQYYNYKEPYAPFSSSLKSYLRQWLSDDISPLITIPDQELLESVNENFTKGITATCPGFYGPQGRAVSLKPRFADFLKVLAGYDYDGYKITNFEMETNAIYGLSSLLGHRALSCSVVLANRITGDFSDDPQNAVEKLIEEGLALVERV